MKKTKVFKLTLMILICILISLVGFLGVYVKHNNNYQNILPRYALASDLKGATSIEFTVDEGTEIIYYDKEGKKIDSSTVTEDNKKDYTKKEVLINNKEDLTLDNYNKVVKIMKERLKFLQTDQYQLDLDKKIGKIILTFEDDYPNDIKSILPMKGSLELIDSNTNDVIINYEDFNSVEASYASLDDGYNTYISLKLNDSGIEKINNTDKYKVATNTENEEESTENKFKIVFDNDEVTEISYDEMLLTGKTLRLTTKTALTSNSTIQSEMNTNTVISKLATMGKMPVVYKLTAEEYVQSVIADNVDYIVIGLVIVSIAIAIYFVIRFKLNGLLAALGFSANIALFLIIIRLTQIAISLNGFVGISILIVLNTILVNYILKNAMNNEKTFSENMKKAYLQSINALVICLIVFAVFSFSAMTVINSMGLLVFWGWIIILLGNLVLTIPMLASVNK